MRKPHVVTGAVFVGAALMVCGAARDASAQAVGRRFAEEPTDGVAMPTAPIAGDYDARAVATSVGGLALLSGAELAGVLSLEDPSVADSSGQGFGIYAATSFGGGLVPRSGIGMGLEWLRPPRSELTPDPGEPFRFTLAYALGLGRSAGFGVAWHHYHDTDGALEGVNSYDLGLATRIDNYVAVAANLRDIATNSIAGSPIQRRYELEVAGRPFATDRLELAVGGRIGETRGDLDGWARIAARVAPGVRVQAAVETRALHEIADTGAGTADFDRRDLRATIGVDIGLGHVTASAAGTTLSDNAGGGTHVLGGQLALRVSEAVEPSVLGERRHLERVELAGDIDARALTQLVLRLRAIARDPAVVGVVVTFDAPSAGWATFEELRGELARVRGRGKKVFAYLVNGSTKDYFVASAADRIYLDPAGGLRLVGLAGTSFYLRGLFDMVGVLPQFEKIGEYKSAPEELTEHTATDVAAKMHDELYHSLWDGWLDAIAGSRKLTRDELTAIVDGGPYSAGELASKPRLVDDVGPPDRIAEAIAKELGGVYPVESAASAEPDRWRRDEVAVVYVDGDITDGKSQDIPLVGQKTAGGESIIAALEAARTDAHVKAIVLRINSPGGSALASELIAREVFAIRGEKPIVCSMSDYAASGGYFVAAGCDTIFAEPMTITGSIGIFSGKLDVSGLAAKLGIGIDLYRQGKHADADSWYRAMTDDERARLLASLQYSYSRFVGAVADGRKLTKDAVDRVGRGHVWTGVQAKPIELVDHLGGLGDALDDAQRRAGISDAHVEITELPARPPGILGAVGSLLGGSLLGVHAAAPAAFGLADIPAVRAVLRQIPASILLEPDAAQARLPWGVEH